MSKQEYLITLSVNELDEVYLDDVIQELKDIRKSVPKKERGRLWVELAGHNVGLAIYKTRS